MADEIKYYAIVGVGRTAHTPSGLARRRFAAGGPFDEALRRDMTWEADSAIVEWEYGDVGADLIEVSEAAAQGLIDRFRAEWGETG